MPEHRVHSPLAARSAPGASVALAYAQPLLELLEERGQNLAQINQDERGHPLFNPSGETMSATSYLRLLDEGAKRCADPQFGLHVGEKVKLGTYNVYGMLLMSCRDFGEAFQQTMRYEALAHDLGRSELIVDGDVAEYRWHSHFPDASPHLAESVFAGIRVFGDWFAGSKLPHAPVYFQHAAPEDISEHRRVFGPGVHFGASCHHSRFPAALLNWPVPHADTGLSAILRQHADQLLMQKHRQHREHEIVNSLRQTISEQLANEQWRLNDIAATLQLSPRTLQRKLAEAGVSFQQILDETRHELALSYLQNADFSLSDIAFLLGYREQSAFQHAFKEWTGVTPGAWRLQHNAAR
ncbi:MAG: AraC family transcriptional regulator [Undibacterium curvum]|uniref:AraC family transcriptional regulator n=1 Tax=Undibacterium curvum TaxID=2762294 RepID=UPI003BC22A4C